MLNCLMVLLSLKEGGEGIIKVVLRFINLNISSIVQLRRNDLAPTNQ